MIQLNTQTAPAVVEYPEDDGLPMADNSKQFWWITTIAANLAGLYRDREDVFVGGNMLWYAREGHPAERFAPDVFVVFGRPKKHRSSYRQWEEDDVPMTVVFEFISPSNSWQEMTHKLAFFSEHGAEEFYIYDPETNDLTIYIRGKTTLRRIHDVADFVSPKMGIRFDSSGPKLVPRHADGRRFRTWDEQEDLHAESVQRDLAVQQMNVAERRLQRLVHLAKRQLTQQATPEGLAELQRLLAQP